MKESSEQLGASVSHNREKTQQNKIQINYGKAACAARRGVECRAEGKCPVLIVPTRRGQGLGIEGSALIRNALEKLSIFQRE